MLAAATIAARLLMFALGIVLARSLGADEYGRYSLALAIGAVLQPVADLGLTPYLLREVARDRALGEASLATLGVAKLAISLVVLGLTVVVAVALTDDVELAVVISALVAAALVDGGSIFVYAYFQGREAMDFEARATTLAAVLRASGGIVLVLVTGDLGPVVAWVVLVSLLQAASALRHLLAVSRSAAIRLGAVAWRDVLAIGLMAIFVIAYLRVDAVLIGWLQDERAVGLYAAAYTIVFALQIPPLMIATALAPVFARSFATARTTFESTWHAGVRAVLLIALPLALTTTLLATSIVARAFGQEFAASAAALALLAWICPLASLNLVAQAALRGAGRERWLLAVTAGCLAFNVGANVWAIPRFGIEGAAGVSIATELLSAVCLLALALRARLLPVPHVPAGRLLVALGTLGGVGVLVADLPPEAGVLACLAAYAAVLVLTRTVTAAELRSASRRALRRGS